MELPEHVRRYLEWRGIKELFPPQWEAVERGLFEGKNLVVAAPTASGKTLIAEMRVLHELVSHDGRRRVVYVVPYRALAREKRRDFERVARFCREELGVDVSVELRTGDVREPIRELEPGVLITTAEKLDASLRSRPGLVDAVDLLVMDEVHLVGESDRGPTYEGLIALVRTFSGASVLALSATVGNARELGRWLGAEVVESNWRPVELRYRVEEVTPSDADNRVDEVVERCLREGGQALVFLYSRRRSMTEAQRLASVVRGHLSRREVEELRELAEQVREEGEGDDTRVLAETVRNGVAFHHAGLAPGQRELVEDAFREGLLKVVTCTPTLAAGVNLPARYVLIRDFGVRVGGQLKPSKNEFKQMAGRAGRPGYDEVGYVYVFVSPRLRELAEEYVRSEAEPVRSRIWSAGPQLRRFILGLVAAGFCEDLSDVLEVSLNTFVESVEWGRSAPEELVVESVRLLREWDFVRELGGRLRVTEVGRAVAETYLNPDSARFLLEVMREMGTEESVVLPAITLSQDFTPAPISWKGREQGTLDAFLGGSSEELSGEEVAELAVEWFGYDDWELERRLAWAEVLRDWVSGVSERVILRRYEIYPGDLYRAREDAAWIAWGMSRLASAAGIRWRCPMLSRRIELGVPEEVLELTEVDGVGRTLALRLYEAGFRSVEDLAEASLSRLTRVRGVGERRARRIRESARRLIGT